MSPTLLHSKIRIPFIQRKCIDRPRLVTRLDRVFTSKLTIVSAPAGYGKTTVLTQWAASSKHPIVWYSLEAGDNDRTRFWIYVATALKAQNDSIGNSALSLLSSSTKSSIEMILTSLINDIVSSGKMLVLILDDYHLITNQKIHDDITFLLHHLPQYLRIIIASRAKLSLSLGRLRAHGQLNELHMDDLRFAVTESLMFFNNLIGTDLYDKRIEKLSEQAEGWIAGLQLIALCIKDRSQVNRILNGFKGHHQYIADFLLEEVLNQQDQTVRSFLLQTSILERMCGSLCESITGISKSSMILEEIEKDSLFTFPLDEEKKWFRYHSFFQTLLLNQLKKSQPERLAELHHRASLWYEKNDYPTRAVDHALAAGNKDRAADLIEANAVHWISKGEMIAMIRWLDSIEESLIRSRPEICIIQGFLSIINPFEGSFDIIEQRIQDVKNAMESEVFNTAPRSYQTRIMRSVACLQASLDQGRGESPEDMIDLLENTLKTTEGDDDLLQNTLALNLTITYRETGDAKAACKTINNNIKFDEPGGFDFFKTYGAYLLALMKYEQGDLKEAANICQRIINRYESDQNLAKADIPVLGAPYMCLGAVLLEMNQVNKAEKYLPKGFELLKVLCDFDTLLVGYGALIRLKTAQGADFTEVTRIINEMSRLGPEAEKYGAVLKIQYLWSHHEQNSNWIAAIGLIMRQYDFGIENQPLFPGIDHPGQRHHEQQICVVRFLIFQQSAMATQNHQSKMSKMMNFLNQKLQLAKDRELFTRIIQIRILKSQLMYANGKIKDALAELRPALSLARNRGFFRIFIDDGESLIKLLKLAVAQGIHREYTTRLVQALKHDDKSNSIHSESATSSVLLEQMSEREVQVLRLVAAGLSNREIAEELYLAVGTVKKHLYNIYGKLNVNRRTQAVSQAKKLSLL
ncbi:MAG: LuxR C-terminal-related transcriptional regulator [Desulfobacula sp.]|uniref:LuxR C-terminal-related transcriptional regulator n=1 Tax=Desulfobacula sp. TaxID=2593537 RepID=UPI0025C4C3BF|nr:LuxR C-terminal-related transcriptional regulator [Desulfobacula sp.]MCD4722690.1 LuxR C-terminal-related transcriptional regulator [Desulfobacula sp.]